MGCDLAEGELICMGKVTRLPRPEIIIDKGEVRSKVPGFLYELQKTKLGQSVDIYDKVKKDGKKYDNCGDYIIVDRAGREWGVERKSFLDCYGSICKGKIDGQLAELCAKYPGHAIFLVEEIGYIPKMMLKKKWAMISIVNGYMSRRSLIMPTFHTSNEKATATTLINFAKDAHKATVGGRGVTISINDDHEGYEYEMPDGSGDIIEL